MVDSPPYPCQFVLVAKLDAVLNDESGETPAMPAGVRGNMPWNRWMAYTAIKPTMLNKTAPKA